MSKFKDIVLMLVIAIFAILYFIERGRDGAKMVVVQKDTAMYRKIGNIEVAWNKSTELTQGQLKLLIAGNDSLSKLVSSYKKVVATIILREQIHIKDSINLKDSIPCAFEPIRIDKHVPSQYSFTGRITNKMLFIDDIFIPNTTSIVVGKRKPSLFKKSEQEISVVHSNPLLKTSEIQNMVIKEKKKILEQPLFWFGSGIAATLVAKIIINTLNKKA